MEKKNKFQLDNQDCIIIREALIKQFNELSKEKFYFPKHPQGFYELYLDKYNDLIWYFSEEPRPILKNYKFN